MSQTGDPDNPPLITAEASLSYALYIPSTDGIAIKFTMTNLAPCKAKLCAASFTPL